LFKGGKGIVRVPSVSKWSKTVTTMALIILRQREMFVTYDFFNDLLATNSFQARGLLDSTEYIYIITLILDIFRFRFFGIHFFTL